MYTWMIEQQLMGYDLFFPQIRIDEVEWKIQLPPFVEVMDNFITQYNRIPSQYEFNNEYIRSRNSQLKEILDNYNTTKKRDQILQGICARAQRTYPSIIRDIHLHYLLIEEGFNVISTREDDISRGIDHIILYDNQPINIHCYVNTPRAKTARQLKTNRHVEQGTHIDLPLDIYSNETKKVNDIYLYSKIHIYKLQQFLNINQGWNYT